MTAGDAAPAAGERVGRYRVRRPLARGGSARVLLADDAETGETVILKRIEAPDAEAALRREAAMLRRLDHPNIARCLDLVVEDGVATLVLDHEDGATLEATLAGLDGGVDAAALARIVGRLAEALASVHAAGLIHRDVKPANVWLRRDGDPVLIDFGAAAAAEGGPATGETLATPGYAPPEQTREGGVEGPAADVYALSALAYRMIAGAPPPDARARIAGETMPPAAALGRGRYPDAVLAAIDAGLALDAAERPSLDAWRRAFEAEATDGAVVPVPTATGEADDDVAPTLRLERVADAAAAVPARTGRAAPARALALGGGRRRWGQVLLLLFVFAAVVAGGWGWFWWQDRARTAWRVDPAGTGDAATIAEALARARPGAPIRLAPGVYVESVRLADAHVLAGPDEGEAVIAPPDGPCLIGEAATGALRRVTLRGAADGLACLDLVGGRLLVEDVVVEGAGGPAVRLRGGADPTIRGGRLVGGAGGPAVLVEDGARGTLTEAQVAGGAKAGVVVRGGAAPLVAGNAIVGPGQAGILVSTDGAGRFVDNRIEAAGASGIEIRGGADPEITGNTIDGASQAGVFVHGGGRGRLAGNLVTASGYSGIVVGPGGDPVVTGNRIVANDEHGVLVLDGGKGRFDGNRIRDNRGHGFALGLGAEAELGENELAGNAEPELQRGRAPAAVGGGE